MFPKQHYNKQSEKQRSLWKHLFRPINLLHSERPYSNSFYKFFLQTNDIIFFIQIPQAKRWVNLRGKFSHSIWNFFITCHLKPRRTDPPSTVKFICVTFHFSGAFTGKNTQGCVILVNPCSPRRVSSFQSRSARARLGSANSGGLRTFHVL